MPIPVDAKKAQELIDSLQAFVYFIDAHRPNDPNYLRDNPEVDTSIEAARAKAEELIKGLKMMLGFEKVQRANRDGYAGVLSNGNLVDRREVPEAHAVAANAMFNITNPRCVECSKITPINELEKSLCPECRKKE